MTGSITVIREMTKEEWISSAETKCVPAQIDRIKGRHVMLARLLALGKKPKDVAELCNYTPQRVYDLMKDPMFDALVKRFEESVNEQLEDVTEFKKLAGQVVGEIGLDMFVEIGRRLKENPEEFSVQQLFKLGGGMLNRTVLPEKTGEKGTPGGGGGATLNIVFEDSKKEKVIDGEFKNVSEGS